MAEGEQVDRGRVGLIAGLFEFPEKQDGLNPAGGAGIAAPEITELEIGLASDAPEDHAAEKLFPLGMGDGGKALEVHQWQHGKTPPRFEGGWMTGIGVRVEGGKVGLPGILMGSGGQTGRIARPGSWSKESCEEREDLSAGDGEHILESGKR